MKIYLMYTQFQNANKERKGERNVHTEREKKIIDK